MGLRGRVVAKLQLSSIRMIEESTCLGINKWAPVMIIYIYIFYGRNWVCSYFYRFPFKLKIMENKMMENIPIFHYFKIGAGTYPASKKAKCNPGKFGNNNTIQGIFVSAALTSMTQQ